MPASSFTRGRRWLWRPKHLGCRLSTWSTSTTKTWRGWGDRPERELSWASQVKSLKSAHVQVLTSTCLSTLDASDFCTAALFLTPLPVAKQRSDTPHLSLVTLSCSSCVQNECYLMLISNASKWPYCPWSYNRLLVFIFFFITVGAAEVNCEQHCGP